MSKEKRFLLLCSYCLAITFCLGVGFSTPQTHAAKAWKAVKKCHAIMNKNIKACADVRPCREKKLEGVIKNSFKSFKKCVKKVTKKAKLKKGSTYKDLSASIQDVIKAVQPIFQKCRTRASTYEKKAIEKYKKKGNLKKMGKKIEKKTSAIRDKCMDEAEKQSMKALQAQIQQHFAK